MAADGHSPFNQSSSVKSRILRGALKHVTASLLAKSTAISSNLMEQEQILNHRGKERSCLLFDADRRANVLTLPESDGPRFGAE